MKLMVFVDVDVDVDVDEINGLCWVSTLAYPNLLGIKRLC